MMDHKPNSRGLDTVQWAFNHSASIEVIRCNLQLLSVFKDYGNPLLSPCEGQMHLSVISVGPMERVSMCL